MTVPGPATSGSRRWVFWIFLALALFYLGVEHRAHLAGTLRWLPLAILLLCPFGRNVCYESQSLCLSPPHWCVTQLSDLVGQPFIHHSFSTLALHRLLPLSASPSLRHFWRFLG